MLAYFQKKFAEATRKKTDAEYWLSELGVKYDRHEDGTLYVPGNLDLSYRCLRQLPDLSSVIINGDFMCHSNELTTLKNSPKFVGGGYYCLNNRLASLEGITQSIGTDLYCAANRLTSLEGAPPKLREIYCENNPLTSFKGAPAEFALLKSDRGTFHSPSELPPAEDETPRAKPKTGFKL